MTVQFEDERGERIGVLWEDVNSTHAIADPNVEDDPKTCCLRFIDPYGDTIFNQRQWPDLLRELRGKRLESTDDRDKRTLDSLIHFLERAPKGPHTYVRFIGD